MSFLDGSARIKARYVSFKCFDDYSASIDMPGALHPQTILALDFLGKPLASEWALPYDCGYRPSSVSRAPRTLGSFLSPTLILAAIGKIAVMNGTRGSECFLWTQARSP